VAALAAKARPGSVEIPAIRANLLFVSHRSYSFDMQRISGAEKKPRQL